ncbi:anthranilate synthase [Guyanagaster necrorhizus]|uniref:Multifunctional tryptophan biosynthesis protein n=1 Tax=Guyanagaster necrorhizus TaxID=856835 RepID=A0A9P7W0A4_9AGAR|nr:anthranilate synthase [Guyanagaster necrorhizus MCA 3950]KAG7449858.1 anthranilate synthase [Guyanagaster necrorhizus MCA 3950]
MSSSLPPALCGQLDVLLIDNFDSFTWNLYQQLCLLGADVTVIRNDAISPEVFPELKLKSLIISPGPGHPKTDSGISRAAIEFFKGKVPVFGVCMGLECMVDLLGGDIAYAGEIMHGKVSRILHDERGCFKGIPQGIKSTRYHSLSAAHTTLPPELAITATTDNSGVIMGVRHRQYTLEAVQYHPESILSEGGDALMRNFLTLRGGTWEENPESRVMDSTLPPFEAKGGGKKIPSVLEKIYHQRLADVVQAQSTPGSTMADLETLYTLNVAPPLVPLLPRLASRPALFAEVKRASPSKGPIAPTISPASQALTYALAGAHVVSVLTEPKWFLGSLQDMLHARLSVGTLSNRPVILRKDFIFSRYQVLESRIWGADTILLIVGLLPEVALRDLYAYSLELGMEPLVEVNNAREMELALSLPAKVIGVNNRNLHDFRVDMDTTTRLSDMAKGKGVVLCALSGITGPADVSRYAAQGVDGVLIGESLMRAKDPAAFIRQLFSLPPPPPPPTSPAPPLVKICGVRTKDEALAIADAGADLLGLMFVESSKRHVSFDTAREICASVRALRFSQPPSPPLLSVDNTPWFTSHAARLSSFPLVVGVFQNQPLSEILHAVSACQLDVVQLHGTEPVEWARQIPVPVIKAFHSEADITRDGYHQFILLDSLRDDGSGVSGGSGKVVDWEFARRVVDGKIFAENSETVPTSAGATNGTTTKPSPPPLPIILAGGLTPENVAAAVEQVQPWAVDVSGGVEMEDGKGKDLEKVRAFIQHAKGVHDQ